VRISARDVFGTPHLDLFPAWLLPQTQLVGQQSRAYA